MSLFTIILSLFIFTRIDFGGTAAKESERLQQVRGGRVDKEVLFGALLKQKRQAWTQCTSNPVSPVHTTDFGPFPSGNVVNLGDGRGRRAADITSTDKALYISGTRGTLFSREFPKAEVIPAGNFTVELWSKPEGGQSNPAVIVEAVDFCTPFPDRGWEIGIRTMDINGEKDARFYFNMRPSRNPQTSTLVSPIKYIPSKWHHLAVTYDGEYLKLFVNGAQVAANSVIAGPIFQQETTFQCRVLELGGHSGHHYRGTIDALRIWNIAKSQPEITSKMYQRDSHQGIEPKTQGLIFSENFQDLDMWQWKEDEIQKLTPAPVLVMSDAPSRPFHLGLRPPPCGVTVCDVPDVIRSYSSHWELRRQKIVRYRVINVKNFDGSNPTVSDKQIRKQHRALVNAFFPYNISWVLQHTPVRNTSLRRRTILLDCRPQSVGNGICDPECQLSLTGNDGGDCDVEHSLCPEAKKGDGQCDHECNKAYNEWDRGDCCTGKAKKFLSTCLDPSSPNRMYISLDEYKSVLNSSNEEQLNVLFARWTNKDIIGIAAFPWEKEVLSYLGGVVVKLNEFGVDGHMNTLVHEFGHALGLWHVHRGVSEMGCHDTCLETEASLTLGDLCADTNPTPQNDECTDPPSEKGKCGLKNFKNTPYDNYMSYADDPCTTTFTNHQVARMHCYLDLKYHKWQDESLRSPPPPPIPPVVVKATEVSVTISWVPPLDREGFHDDRVCSMCSSDRALFQYASKAEATSTSTTYGDSWKPHQATGPPDAISCTPSEKAWMPDFHHCNGNGCTITLIFDFPVIPAILSIWISYNAKEGLSEVVFPFTDGTVDVITNIKAYCDMPLTLSLSTDKTLEKILLKTRAPSVTVDAVQLVSVPNHPKCDPCKPIRYRVFRTPPFSSGDSKVVDDTVFTDSEVVKKQVYTYAVKAWLGSRETFLSPSLKYLHGNETCGDGKISRSNGEECDDENLMDGDGCDKQCKVEKSFLCRGTPSSCYWHKGDGVCEHFEQFSNPRDCGFHTPPGFRNQWASEVKTNEPHNIQCSPQVIIGPPVKPGTCEASPNTSYSWYPCDSINNNDFWLQALFPDTVVATSVSIYFTSDGISAISHDSSEITIELLDTEGSSHLMGKFFLSCNRNPLETPWFQDLSQPFFHTKAVKISFVNSRIAISGILLRSSRYLDPIALSQCLPRQLYSPTLRRCVDYVCQKPRCHQPLVKNAFLNCTGYEDGDVCKWSCEDGYVAFSTEKTITCNQGEWKGEPVLCKPLDCGFPRIPHADAGCPEGTTFGKQCNFKCRPPARLKGADTLSAVSCLKTGQWSSPTSECQVTCVAPSPPTHAVLISQQCKITDSFQYGQRCWYRCKLGYHVSGYSERSHYLRCGDRGVWYGPHCVPDSCPPMPAMYSGLYNCTNGFLYGSECTFYCPNRKPTVRRCEVDGLWNEPFPLCSPGSGFCKKPKSERKGVEFHCDKVTIGEACNVSCETYDHQLALRTAGKNIKFVEQKITCTARQKWYPDPASIFCVEKCKEMFVGDSYCDGVNNRELCHWDGGDCCKSTVKGHEVKPFPAHCKTECRCLDPNAVENNRGTDNKQGKEFVAKRRYRNGG